MKYIMDLDILSFDSLAGSIHRIQSSKISEDALMMRSVMHADVKAFKQVLDPYFKAMTEGTGKLKPGTKTSSDFIKKYGRGF